MDKRFILLALFLFSFTFVAAYNQSEFLYCHDEGYFCVDSDFCDAVDVAEDHVCASAYERCCMARPTCERANGTVCSSRDKCEGYHLRAVDTEDCCIGRCNEPQEPTTVFCEEAGFYCMPKSLCSSDNVLDNQYYCSGLTNVCCKEHERQTCGEIGGVICPSDQVCQGYITEAKDTNFCCLAGCAEPKPETTECEEAYYACYENGCPVGYGENDNDCSGQGVCCQYIQPIPPEKSTIEIVLGLIGNFFEEIIDFMFSGTFLILLLMTLMAGIIYLLTRKSKMTQRIEILNQMIEEQQKMIDSQKGQKKEATKNGKK